MDTEAFLIERRSIEQRMVARRAQPVTESLWWSLLKQLPLLSLASGLFLGFRPARRRAAPLGGNLWLALATPVLAGLARRWNLEHYLSHDSWHEALRKVPFLSRFLRKTD